MKISKNKTMFTRLVTAMISTLMLVVVFSFSAASVMAMAADNTPKAVTVSELPTAEENFEVTPLDTPVADSDENPEVTPIDTLDNMNIESVNTVETPNMVRLTSLDGQTNGDSQFQSVVNFFVKWIKRVGLLVAFVGGVMFGLAIKNNDADQKQNGLLTLVAGFVVAALCQAVDMFDIFS